MYTFADDTKLISKISSVDDTFVLQNNLNFIISWSEQNKMVLNNKKFEFLSHKSPSNVKSSKFLSVLPFFNLTELYHASNLFEIPKSSFVRDLGVLVDESLNWKLHIDKLTNRCRQLCSWALSVFHTRQAYPMLTIFKSLILSRLEYCSLVWNPYQIQDIDRIEQIQRKFTSKIDGMADKNYWERLSSLNILSLQRRREKAIIVHVWKILNGLCPNSIDLQFKEHARSSAIKAVVKPLPKLSGKILTLYENSFAIKSAQLWNILPPNLTKINALLNFQVSLDNFLKKIPDKPPVAGYPHSSNNSLTNLCA